MPNTVTALADGALYVVSYRNELLAKQLSILGGRWSTESLNKDDPKWRKPALIDEHKGFTINGQCVGSEAGKTETKMEDV